MTKQVVTLVNWGCSAIGIRYENNNVSAVGLCGTVFGHPKLDDGRKIETSAIVSAHGMCITTANTTYLLKGPPDPGYLEYLKIEGFAFDPDNPIKLPDADM